MTDASAVFVDTNVLLTATSPRRALHTNALRVLNDWPNRGIPLCTSGQIMREYLVVATRPTALNGLGMGTPEALANANAIRSRMRFLNENRAVFARLSALLNDINCSGKNIHDANVVATALSHGVQRILTSNIQDYERFVPGVELLGLPEG